MKQKNYFKVWFISGAGINVFYIYGSVPVNKDGFIRFKIELLFGIVKNIGKKIIKTDRIESRIRKSEFAISVRIYGYVTA